LNLSLYIAKRYAISFSKNKAINIITGIASVGIIASTMALFVFLSVFSGLKEFTLDFANATDPDYKVETATGKFFTLTPTQEVQLRKSGVLTAYSKVVSERVYFVYDAKEIVAEIKGVDTQFAAVTDFNQHLYVGEWLAPNSEEVVVGAEISRKLALGLFDYNHQLEVYAPKPGKGSIENPEDAFNKALLFPSGVYSVNEEMDGKFVFCDLVLAQRLLGLPAQKLTALELKVAPQHSEEEVRQTLQRILGNGIKIKNRAQLNDALYKMLQSENLFIYLLTNVITYTIIITDQTKLFNERRPYYVGS
jgi:lipoprotein-releasing system permease protein